MYNYRQHDISEATAKRLEEAEKFIDTRLTMAKLAINDGDFQDADLCFEEAYSRWDEVYRDPKEWYDEEAESLYEALGKAWEAFR